MVMLYFFDEFMEGDPSGKTSTPAENPTLGIEKAEKSEADG